MKPFNTQVVDKRNIPKKAMVSNVWEYHKTHQAVNKYMTGLNTQPTERTRVPTDMGFSRDGSLLDS